MSAPVFTQSQILWLAAFVAGGRGNVDIATAVCLAESSGRPDAYNDNAGPPPSRDRGLWQINSMFHSEVSDDCAYRALCNARNAFRISNEWTDFTPWATFNKGLYLEHMPPPLLPETPIPSSQLSTYYPPSSAPSGILVAGSPLQSTFAVSGRPPTESAQDSSQKIVTTGRRASIHGASVNSAANAIDRIPAGRTHY